jgi:hypothetical protein
MRVDPMPNGFVGTFSGNNTPSGRIAAALSGAPKLEGVGWRNGMWFNPNESGWGLNVIEQGDTIFATLYVYDSRGNPRWYVASQLTQSGATADGTAINSGPLYEVIGPYFGGSSFNPSNVARRQVGNMSFQVRSPGSAVVTYTVDAFTVTKNVTQLAFRRNDASGTYIGQITDPSVGHDPVVVTIADKGNTIAMRIQGMFGGTCDYNGQSEQVGDVINASGSLGCGGGSTATFVMRNLTVGGDGITAHIELGNVTGFVQDGLRVFNLAGARSG